MSTHYLIDTTMTPIANSEINEVRLAKDGTSVLGGNFIVRLPDGVSIGPNNPTDLTDLLTKKYAGLLAFYAGYTRITYDDLLDSLGVDTATSSQILLGERSAIRLLSLGGGVFQSNPFPLTGTAPAQAIITYETFFLPQLNPSNGRLSKTYQESSPPTVTTCEVSFNGGVSFLTTTDGVLLNIPPLDQGTSFVIRITSTILFLQIGIGSWAVIY